MTQTIIVHVNQKSLGHMSNIQNAFQLFPHNSPPADLHVVLKPILPVIVNLTDFREPYMSESSSTDTLFSRLSTDLLIPSLTVKKLCN